MSERPSLRARISGGPWPLARGVVVTDDGGIEGPCRPIEAVAARRGRRGRAWSSGKGGKVRATPLVAGGVPDRR